MIFSNKYGLTAQLNEDDCTAKIIYSPHVTDDVIIPRSIIYKSDEYVITSIDKDSFRKNFSIKSISFSVDSEVQTIEKKAFLASSIKKISFPSSLQKLKEGWCEETNELNSIEISPHDKTYSYVDDKIIIGKSDVKSKIYDKLVFVRRDIEKVIIPSFIKHIDPYALDGCSKLQTIEFSEDSNLQTIGKCAFASTGLKHISIPPQFNNFKEGWCQETYFLVDVEISHKNPHYIYYDNDVVFGKSDTTSPNFDVLIFASRDIININVPSFIKRIDSFAFDECEYLKSVYFENNSQLTSIGKCAFFSTRINRISIPSNVKHIEKSAFNDCSNLKKVRFMDQSELISIGKKAFMTCSIENISIPSKVNFIDVLAFSFCSELKTIEILGESLFCNQFCFKGCRCLNLISFPNANEIKISMNSFDDTSTDFIFFTRKCIHLDIF